MSSRRGGRGGARGGPVPRDVQVSKKLSWLLRHGAAEENLALGEGGFANLQDVLSNRKIRSLKVTLDEIREIVQDNEKQRFTLKPIAPDGEDGQSDGQTPLSSSKPADYLIRANQGHSLKVESEGLLKPITPDNIPETVIHGTTHSAWPLVVSSGGLKPMGRNHVHFATGLPAGFKSIAEDADASKAAPVISGMRSNSTVLVFIDIKRAMDANVKFWISDNGVVLSEGNAEGVVPLEFFKRVEDRTGEGILVENGKVVKDAPARWTHGHG